MVNPNQFQTLNKTTKSIIFYRICEYNRICYLSENVYVDVVTDGKCSYIFPENLV